MAKFLIVFLFVLVGCTSPDCIQREVLVKPVQGVVSKYLKYLESDTVLTDLERRTYTREAKILESLVTTEK